MLGKCLFLPLCHSHNDYKVLLWLLFKIVKVDRFYNPGFRKSLLHVFQCSECFLCCFMSVQASWASLRTEFVALNPAQLHHMLREYSSAKACPPGWTPSADDAEEAIRTGE